jgi:HlyD family secretion protein
LKKRTKIWLGVLVVVAGGIGFQAKIAHDGKLVTEVDLKTIERKSLRSTISASGKIKPKMMVNVSAAVSGKVLEVCVHEGDSVEKGQRLLRIDPTPFETEVQQLEASIRSAKANIELQKANLAQSKSRLRRSESLQKQGLVTDEQLETEQTTVSVEEARLAAADQELPRLQAGIDQARHELTKVDVLSDISGTVTALNIEAGEYAFVGAFNNPATVLLTVADLDVIEAEVEVDESQAVKAKAGQTAELEIDAHVDWVFQGRVTEVGHTPVTKLTGAEREGTSYLVKILVQDKIPGVRPGLTCSARICSDTREAVLAVPIEAMAMRKPLSESTWKGDARTEGGAAVAVAAEPPASAADDPSKAVAKSARTPAGDAKGASDPEHLTGSDATRREDKDGKVEGVFYVKDGKAWFQPVKLGITGEKDFELRDSGGLGEGAQIVVGPYSVLHKLKDGDRVKQQEKKEGEKSSG